MSKWIFDMVMIGFVIFIGYCLLLGINNKRLATLLLTVGGAIMLLTTMQDLTPVIQRWNTRIDTLQETGNQLANIGQGSWEMPMRGEISQAYKGEAHHGIDIAAPEGTPVSSAKKGEVIKVGWNDIYGNVIIVDHGDGVESLYGHLSGLNVKVGYPVIVGTRIGSCGNTGRSTGPHLHFEIRKNGTCVDPMSYLK